MIRIDALWLCAAPVDMRSGTERLFAHVITALGAAHAHHGYALRLGHDARHRIKPAPAFVEEGLV